jgi:hypothetical protein
MATGRKSEQRVINQVVAPRKQKRGGRPQPPARSDLGELLRSARFFARPAAALVAAVLLIIGYNALAGSSLFEVRRVEVSGASAPLSSDIEHTVRRAIGQTRLLDLDLATIKQKVEAITRVRQASVARILPDGIFVQVVERAPAILARRESQAIVWLDDEGVELGDSSIFASAETPPIARGLSEGARSAAAVADDRERIAVYKQIESEFKQGPDPVWNFIDEIDLTFIKNVNLRLTSPPVTVVVGSRDFRKRFDAALSVLNAARKGDRDYLSKFPGVQDPDHLTENADRIAFMDVSRSDRIVLSFSAGPRASDEEASSSVKPKPSEKKNARQEPKNRGQVKR